MTEKYGIKLHDDGSPINYEDVEVYTWEEFLDQIEVGIIVPVKEGTALVHWYEK